jgi:hypothetical protein
MDKEQISFQMETFTLVNMKTENLKVMDNTNGLMGTHTLEISNMG